MAQEGNRKPGSYSFLWIRGKVYDPGPMVTEARPVSL